MFEVNAVELEKCLIEDLKVKTTAMVTSSPGMGKSAIIKSIAEQFGLKVIDLRVSQLEPVDLNGFPDKENGRMVFNLPDYLPIETDPIPEGYNGWLLFLDEFNSGSKQTEAAGYKIILDRMVHQTKLHDRCLILAAGNLSTDRAIVNTQSTATTSRLTHYRMRIDHEAWLDWANANDIDHRVISFIKFKPEILHKFNPDTAELTFPCPRTWAFASKIVKPFDTVDKIAKIRLAGTIGEGAAVEFATYTQIYKSLPTIDQIIADPQYGWKVPTEASEQYAVTTMLSHNMNEENIEKIMVAIERLPTEFQILTLRDVYKKSPNLKKHPAIKEWVGQHSSEIF